MDPALALPSGPPFTLRARLLTPLANGGLHDEPDARIEVRGAWVRGRLLPA